MIPLGHRLLSTGLEEAGVRNGFGGKPSGHLEQRSRPLAPVGKGMVITDVLEGLGLALGQFEQQLATHDSLLVVVANQASRFRASDPG